jgi:hypothetical protein
MKVKGLTAAEDAQIYGAEGIVNLRALARAAYKRMKKPMQRRLDTWVPEWSGEQVLIAIAWQSLKKKGEKFEPGAMEVLEAALANKERSLVE